MTVAIHRPLKGSRISTFYPVKSLPPLSALDSAFQLQEYISLLIRLDVHNVERIVSIPGKEHNESAENGSSKGEDKDADKDAAGGVNVDPACWVYEHLRRVAQDLSHPLITMLQQECTRNTCPEMKAGEWLYLCVAHGNEGAMEQCCAIDYILHTLDSATALLNSPRAFPSRLSIPATSHRHFTSLCRRLGRIFAHAYFHHREVFEQAEAESSLYARFLALVKYFDLVPLEFLVIPPRMEGRIDPVEPPRLMGASLEPRRYFEGGGLRTDRGKSPPGPAGQTRNESPRKFGRARTDTMVYSEAYSVAEELAKGDLSEVDIDREIAAERAAAAAGPTELYVPPPEQIPASAPAEVSAPLTAAESEKEEEPAESQPPSQAVEEDAAKPSEDDSLSATADEPLSASADESGGSATDTSSEELAQAPEDPSAPAPEESSAAEHEHTAEPSLEEADTAIDTEVMEGTTASEKSESAPPSPAPVEGPSETAEPSAEAVAEASSEEVSEAVVKSDPPEPLPVAGAPLEADEVSNTEELAEHAGAPSHVE
ncbi:Mob1/phocein [Trametes punicea]|nr:Mob1/phocein [Trametes punicea]